MEPLLCVDDCGAAVGSLLLSEGVNAASPRQTETLLKGVTSHFGGRSATPTLHLPAGRLEPITVAEAASATLQYSEPCPQT